MLENLRSALMAAIFGSGLAREVGDRGIAWLSRETREAITKADQPLTEVRLKPGESYTILARPKATRSERKLARAAAALAEADARMSAPTHKQKRLARRLGKKQHKLDRRRPGTRRYAREKAGEVALGKRFDRAMAPTPKLRKVRSLLATTEKELARQRSANLARARSALGDGEAVTTVYD
jgi:hypothetical protein